VGGVICSEIKGPLTPKSRLGNRYMVNFVVFQSNYCHVLLTRTKDAVANLFEPFLVFFEKESDYKVQVLRTDSRGEYDNVDLFCKRTGVVRQRSGARNQSRNGKTERMHGTIMNMARCMNIACGLSLRFWDEAVSIRQDRKGGIAGHLPPPSAQNGDSRGRAQTPECDHRHRVGAGVEVRPL